MVENLKFDMLLGLPVVLWTHHVIPYLPAQALCRMSRCNRVCARYFYSPDAWSWLQSQLERMASVWKRPLYSPDHPRICSTHVLVRTIDELRRDSLQDWYLPDSEAIGVSAGGPDTYPACVGTLNAAQSAGLLGMLQIESTYFSVNDIAIIVLCTNRNVMISSPRGIRGFAYRAKCYGFQELWYYRKLWRLIK